MSINIGQELLNVPMGDMIREMAFAIADAQVKLDENSIEVAEMMGGLKTVRDDSTGEITFEDSRVFFGREKTTLANAVSLFNNSGDEQFRTRLEQDVLDSSGGSHGSLVTKTGTGLTATYAVNDVPGHGNDIVQVSSRLSMLELGFSPTFYQFVDTIIEVRMAISTSRESSTEVKVTSDSKRVDRSFSLSFQRGKLSKTNSVTVTTTQVNATYASKYNYSAEGSSLLRTKLTPIPPPAILEDRIRLLMDTFN